VTLLSESEKISYGKQALIWGAALLLVQLSLGTGFVFLTLWFASVPAVLLYVKTDRRWFAGIAAGTMIVGAAIYGAMAFLFLAMALMTLVPGIVLGEAYRRRKTARAAITAGVVGYLAMYLILILVATMLGFNLTSEIAASTRETVDRFMVDSAREMITEETMQGFIDLYVMLIPLILIASSTLLTAITHTVSRRIANRTKGLSIPSLPPVRDWRLPRSFVWYYLIALFAELFVPVDRESFLSTVVVNLVPLFMFAFVVQGLSFLFFLGHEKRKKWIPWVGLIAVVLLNPLTMPFSLLGVFDTAFPIRDRFRRKS